MRARLAILLAGTVALGGCAYGYGGYGPYGGLSVGVRYGSGYGGYGGYGSCYDPYSAAGGYGGYDYYGFPTGGYGYGSCGYGGGYGAYGSSPYYGWYGDYYYPGTGYYVYDRYRRPHVWSDRQKRYWTHQRERSLSATRTTTGTQQPVIRENWGGFDRTRESTQRMPAQTQRTQAREQRREDRQQVREQRREDRKSDSTKPE